MSIENPKIGVVGLGYVGLPLALAFARHFDTIGFDISATRIEALQQGHDATGEADADQFSAAMQIRYANTIEALGDRDVYIVTVPTPIDHDKRPDFSPLVSASQSIGQVLKRGDVVIYESTVYPGGTEEVCIPVLERSSGLVFNRDFTVGYSPERINPGDRNRRLADIVKVTSGSTPATADFVDGLYRRIIRAGTHRASSIKVAEAAKVIENTQRDANIALVNEFSLIFQRLGIDTQEVLAAAATKWNFLPFKPGLVGGHCIGVDPYYLIQKAQSVGYYPDILLACRRINDAMGKYVASEVIKLMIRKGYAIADAKVLVLGLAFKENCSDLRNTRVIELVDEFKSFGAHVDVHDPLVDPVEAKQEYGITLLEKTPTAASYDAVILAVAHDVFVQMGVTGVRAFATDRAVLYDIKGVFAKADVDGRL